MTAAIETPEFFEDDATIGFGNARSAIPDFDRELAATTTTADQHATALGIAHSVLQEVLQHAAQQLRVMADRGQKARFRLIRTFGFSARQRQSRGTYVDALLKRFRGALSPLRWRVIR